MKYAAARTALVALVGNPNAGKTSLFNALTGAHQKVANYPGITVERVSGERALGDQRIEFLDVPGLYSLKAVTLDEEVALEVVEDEPDALIIVIDATNLGRSLYLYAQLADRFPRLLIALTMTDLLRGATLDVTGLEHALRARVVPVVPHKGVGIDDLFQALDEVLRTTPSLPRLGKSVAWTAAEQLIIQALAQEGVDLSREEAYAALSGEGPSLDERVTASPALQAKIETIRRSLDEPESTDQRYTWAARVAKDMVRYPRDWHPKSVTDRIDRVLTHRVFGVAVFIGVMYAMFQSIYTFAEPLMSQIEGAFGWVGDIVGGWLAPWPVMRSLAVDGLIAGVGSVLTFLPQIAILFLCIALLEGTGYLARAAFLMDRLLGWAGLNGRAFVPLLSSFACAIPGIMAARVMPDARSRLATILVAPLMSCSARLPVYVLVIGAFIEPSYGAAWAGFALFAMHFVGLAVAIPVVWVLNRGLLRGRRMPFLLELPPYQWPKARDVFLTVFFRAKVFVKTAGTIIVAMAVVIWALLYFPRSDFSQPAWRAEYASLPVERRETVSEDAFVQARHTEQSYLGRFGKEIEPIFAPAGFDWRLATAILAAFPAREVVISALGILFTLGGDVGEESTDLRQALQQATWPDGRVLLTPWTAVGLMVFFALCCQCGATLATIKRETGTWRWPVFVFAYMTALSYLAAVGIQALGRAVG